ncbi:MAG: AGE family epimerase/isomerase [Blastopirellula sp. JB062]
MTLEQWQIQAEKFRSDLLEDTLPFWLDRAIDYDLGGYFTAFDREGRLLQTDKPVWFQGRFAWTLASVAQTTDQNEHLLQYARHGLDFLDAHCVDSDGRYFFQVTREGRPLRKRRYVFSECFAAMAMAAYGVAQDDAAYRDRSLRLLRFILEQLQTPGKLEPKVSPSVRSLKSLATPMILIGVAQEVRKATQDPFCNQVIDDCVAEIQRDFVKPDLQCVLETVGRQGECVDTFEGRQVNPGHSLELAWFLLEESRQRSSTEIERLGLQIVDWSLQIGWDQEYGGLYYFRDCQGLPNTEYWHDMKFWWPHNEAIYATLLAWRVTEDPKYWNWHEKISQWAHQQFADPEFGEWFGYLHRDGTLSTTLKGNDWKGPFHLPRMQLFCWKLLEEVIHAQPV